MENKEKAIIPSRHVPRKEVLPVGVKRVWKSTDLNKTLKTLFPPIEK